MLGEPGRSHVFRYGASNMLPVEKRRAIGFLLMTPRTRLLVSAIALFVLLCAGQGWAQDLGAEAQAQQILELLRRGRFDEVTTRFASQLASEMSEQALEVR